jgi:hypothetical protein
LDQLWIAKVRITERIRIVIVPQNNFAAHQIAPTTIAICTAKAPIPQPHQSRWISIAASVTNSAQERPAFAVIL